MPLELDRLIRYLEDEQGLDDVAGDTELFSSGLLDSFTLVDVILYVETEAGIKIPAPDVSYENLDTPDRMLAYALSKGGGVASSAPAAVEETNAIVDAYSEVAREYDGSANAESFWDGISRAAVRAIDTERGYGAIADIGCGTGTALAALAERVGPDVRLFGVEPADQMRARAVDRTQQFPAVTVSAGKLEALPLEAHAVDYLFSNWAFHWTADPELAAAEIARVLRPDGELDLIFTGRHSGTEFTPVISPIYAKYMGLDGLLASAKQRQALDADATRELFAPHFDDARLEVQDVYRTYYDTLDGHWGWWVRIEGHFSGIADDERAACDREVRAALASLETDAGIPYTMHMVHVRVRRALS